MGMTYSEKLKDPRWQKLRLEILSRDNFACKICGNGKEELHVHHRFYKKGKSPWDYESNLLVTLCATHHTQIERLNKTLLAYSSLSKQEFDALNYIVACFEKDLQEQVIAMLSGLLSANFEGFKHGICVEASRKEGNS